MKRLAKIVVFLGIIIGLFFLADYLFHFIDVSPNNEEVNIDPVPFQNGVYKEYYGDSVLKATTVFVGGLKHGQSMRYYPNGMLQEVSYYLNDQRTGKNYFFSEGGNLALIKTFYEDSLLFEMIVNDSVYKYEYNPVGYGMILYDENCSTCHADFTDELSSQLRSKWLLMDTLAEPLNIAQFHSLKLDSIALDSSVVFRESFDSSVVLNKPDILSILDFYKADSSRVKRYPIIKKLRVNSPKI